MMNKFDLIKAALEGKSTSRIPYAFWTHLPGIDLDPVKLADETYSFYKKYDIDFVKTMPNGLFTVEDFGCKCDYSEIKNGGIAQIAETPIKSKKDWQKVEPVSINKGSLGRELKSLKLLLQKVNGDAPVIVTVFSPITTAAKLSDNGLLKDIKDEDNKELIQQALKAITITTANFIEKAIDLGADGIFFATQLSSYEYMSEDEYKEFGLPSDKKVLKSASEGWFNVLHLHGNNVMFNLLKDYEVNAINWHVWETEPTIEKAKEITDKSLVGGIVRTDITQNNKKKIYNQIYNSLKQSKGRKHILTPGCVIRYPLNEESLSYVKGAISEIEKKLL